MLAEMSSITADVFTRRAKSDGDGKGPEQSKKMYFLVLLEAFIVIPGVSVVAFMVISLKLVDHLVQL